MVLKQLELFRFMQFSHITIDFAPGLNIIRGPNESGKSTLRQALLTTFYGNPTSTSESINARSSWGQNKRCECRLDFLDDTGTLCKLRKDFESKTVFLLREQESFRSWGTIRDMLNSFLGIPTEELYTLCASLDVRLLANLGSKDSRKQVGKMLTGLMSGTPAGQDVVQILKRLDESRKELRKGEGSAPAKNPGPLRTAKEQLQQLLAKKSDAEKRLEIRTQKQKELESVKPLRAEMKERLEGINRLIKANLQLAEAEKRKADLVHQESDFDNNQRFREKKEQELAGLNELIVHSRLAQWSLADIESLQMNHRKQELLGNTNLPQPKTDVHTRYLIGFGVLMSLVAVGLIGFNKVFAMLSLIGGIGVLFLGWNKLRSEKMHQQDYRLQRDQHHREMETINQALAQMSEKAGGLTVLDILSNWQEFQQQQIRKQTLAQQLAETPLVNQERWQTIRRELRLLEDEMKDPALQALKVIPLELAKKQKESSHFEEEYARLTRQETQLEALIAHQTGNSEEIAGLEEQISLCRERIEYLIQRDKICELAYRFLDQARRDTLNPARQVLEQRAGELFAQFSQGKYQHIAVDDEDLSSKILISVPGEPEGTWVSPEVLSQGAFDQFYLSLRLALADIISQGQKSPLLLDEPLSAFDPDRVQATLRQLKQISRERQILFFTCRPDYDGMADHLIQLEKRP